MMAQQPGDHGVDGIEHVGGRGRDAETGQLVGILGRETGRVVGEEEDLAIQLAKRGDEAPGARQDLSAEIERPVQIEDVSGSQVVRPAEELLGGRFRIN